MAEREGSNPRRRPGICNLQIARCRDCRECHLCRRALHGIHAAVVSNPCGHDRQRQNRRKPARCRPTTVSGFTMTSTSFQRDHVCPQDGPEELIQRGQGRPRHCRPTFRRHGQDGNIRCYARHLYVQWDVGFEWDAAKASANFRHHGVRFEESTAVFDDAYAITIADDEADPSEERFVSIGMGALGRVLIVVHTYRGDNIRIISARLATAHERTEYEAGLP